MKNVLKYLFVIVILLTITSFRDGGQIISTADQLKGSWINETASGETLLVFIDGYHTQSVYSKSAKKFTETSGGTFTADGNKLNISYEFDSRDAARIGQSLNFSFTVKNDELVIVNGTNTATFKRVDDGTAPLAGLWSISGRMQENKIVPIHRTGTRKTIKILSGKRFQWAAIDPGTKQFSGTGGGTYDFVDGKYTEHIEFFSRDSSRVGASLSFDGKLENGEWHHSGLSSKGDKIYEIWSRSTSK